MWLWVGFVGSAAGGWFHRWLFQGRQKSIQRKELQSEKSNLPEVGISLMAVG